MNPIIGPLDVQEIKPVYFLFSDELPTGANMTTASIDVALVSGTDANPNSILTGDITIDNTARIVSQRVEAPGRAGNRYRLRCVATDNQGNRHTIAAELAVVRL